MTATTSDITIRILHQGDLRLDAARINARSAEAIDLEIHWRERCEIDRARTDWLRDAMRPRQVIALFATTALVGVGDETPDDEVPPPERQTVVELGGLQEWMVARAECGRYCLRLVLYRPPPPCAPAALQTESAPEPLPLMPMEAK